MSAVPFLPFSLPSSQFFPPSWLILDKWRFEGVLGGGFQIIFCSFLRLLWPPYFQVFCSLFGQEAPHLITFSYFVPPIRSLPPLPYHFLPQQTSFVSPCLEIYLPLWFSALPLANPAFMDRPSLLPIYVRFRCFCITEFFLNILLEISCPSANLESLFLLWLFSLPFDEHVLAFGAEDAPLFPIFVF